MHKFCCPERFITLDRQFHDGKLTRVQDDCASSKPFPVTNGAKQDCLMTPSLSNMMFSAMLMMSSMAMILEWLLCSSLMRGS